MEPINICYSVAPIQRSLATDQIADLFGLSDVEPPHVIAKDLSLDLQPGDVVLFTGPSGSGKSSILRHVGQSLNAVDILKLPLPEVPLVEALPGPLSERLDRLSACGLSEARLFLRTPSELSDGQRYRFRLALGLAQESPVLLADEFAAYLDRPLAKVVSYNLRKWASRTGKAFLLATTHEDIASDLRPDLHVRCLGDGEVQVTRNQNTRAPMPISFADELKIVPGTKTDWLKFAKWHYRSHHVAFVRRVVVLLHLDQPVGIAVFTCPAASLSLRTKYFGLEGPRRKLALSGLNQQLWLLSRVVLHPTYRGAGIAAKFVREACESCPVNWIETLSAMGQINPFFERAGFQKVGQIARPIRQQAYGGQYGQRGVKCSAETIRKSRYAEPVYYVFDNRKRTNR